MIDTISLLNKTLLKRLDAGASEDVTSQILDVFERLSDMDMTVTVLAETRIGSTVSKFKSFEGESEVARRAKAIVKGWKALARREGVSSGSKKATSPVEKRKPDPAPSVSLKSKTVETSVGSATLPPERWNSLPSMRRKFCLKFLELFVSENTDENADMEKLQNCAGAIESAIYDLRLEKSEVMAKCRQLAFNLRKNAPLRTRVLEGTVLPVALVRMSAEELATEESARAREEMLKKLHDASRLDWEKANDDKINEMCGIKGDLLKASLFTCNRCKSTKTTSTQKQTRSADEPMTVFVFCTNCGKRWKC